MKYSISIAFISFLLAIIVGVAFVFPNYQKVAILKANILQKEKTLKNQQIYFSKLEKMNNRLANYQASLEKINTMLPSQNKFSSFVYSLNQKAQELGLTLSQIVVSSPKPFKESKRIKEYDLSLGLVGSYPQFKQLVEYLERSARLIDISEVTISEQNIEGQPGQCRIRARIYSY